MTLSLSKLINWAGRSKPISPRDEQGRYLSAHRLAVREKCREQCARMGKEVPAVLR